MSDAPEDRGARRAARAIDALRRGWPFRVNGPDGALDLLAVESARDAALAEFAGHDMLLSGERAVTLKLTNQRAARQEQVTTGEVGERRIARAFDREQVERPVRPAHPQRPAAPQRIDRARRAPGAAIRRRIAQKSNSVISGIWSDGRSQLRAGWTMRCDTAAVIRSGVAHIWSSRRPRFDACQSFAR